MIMSAHNFFALLKKLPGIAGLVGASVLLSLPALAQSEPSSTGTNEASAEVAQAEGDTGAASEIELSPEGLEILCERFPLNSRCEGSAATDTSGDSGVSDEAGSATESGVEGEALEPGAAVDDPSEAVDPSGELETPVPGELEPGLEAPAPEENSMDGAGTLEPNSEIDALEPGSELEEAPVPDQLPDDANDSSLPDDSMSPEATPPTSTPGTEMTPGTMSPQSSVPDAAEESAVLAQAPEAPAPAPGVAPAPAPGVAPAPTSVSDEELQQFANVIPELQALEQSAQQEVAQVIDGSGISRERFTQLFQAQQSPSAEVDASEDEQQSFNEAISQIQTIERETLSQQEQVLQSEGLEPNRFNQILAAVRQDPALQQQVQQLIQN
jgi:hypothetical protein